MEAVLSTMPRVERLDLAHLELPGRRVVIGGQVAWHRDELDPEVVHLSHCAPYLPPDSPG
jgi:hypothetical protein